MYTLADGTQMTRRKLLTINQASAALTDYQIKKTITYVAGNMQTDFQDLRFATLSGTNIPYWEESVTTSTSATVWLKVSAISNTEDTQVWMYYGNSSVSSASSGTNTFVAYHGAATTDYADTPSFEFNNLVYEARVKTTVSNHYIKWGMQDADGDWSDYTIIQIYSPQNRRWIITRSSGLETSPYSSPSLTPDVYYKLKITRDGTTTRGYIDNVEISSGSTTNIPTCDLGLSTIAHTGTAVQDWSFVRKYTATEPTWATDGVEQHQRRTPYFMS